MQRTEINVITGEVSLIDLTPEEIANLPVYEPQPITRFSSLEYLQKFTDDEYQAARTGSMNVQRGLDMLIAAQYVDLDDERIGFYLDLLVAEEAISPERRTELLTPEAAE